jgi:hypothetical protein
MDDIDDSAYDEDELDPAVAAEFAGFEAKRRWMMRIATTLAVLFGFQTLLQMLRLARDTSAEAGLLVVVVAIFTAVENAALVWGTPLILSVAFAPRAWIVGSPAGRAWLARSGMKRDSVRGLRIVAFLVGFIMFVIASVQIYLVINMLIAIIEGR